MAKPKKLNWACLGLGTETIGDTQRVGPLAGSMISCCSRDSTQASRSLVDGMGCVSAIAA